MQRQTANVIQVEHVQTRLGGNLIHSDVNFSIKKAKVTALIGASGCGKSVLIREIIGLLRPAAGSIHVLGTNMWTASNEELDAVLCRMGVLFQDGALFSNLTVGENVSIPMREQIKVAPELIPRLVDLRLTLAGLSPKHRHKLPAQLSGGMRKRAALARAISLEPELLVLDEPTSGLDPVTARQFDELVQTLARSLGITVLMATHDLDTLGSIVDHVIVLDGGTIVAEGTLEEIKQVEHPWLKSYFSGRY